MTERPGDLPPYRSLDHWRGVAVLWVVLFHGFGTTYDRQLHPIAEALKVVAAPGWLGVHIFFVVSGYCIAASAHRLKSRGHPVTAFVRDRLMRIFPTYWAALATAIALNLVASAFNTTTPMENFPRTAVDWLGNILLVQPYVDARYYLIIYWSLVVEMGFYALVVLLWLSARISGRFAVVLFAVLTLASTFVPAQAQGIVLACWPEFACGALVYGSMIADRHGRRGERNALLGGIFVLGLIGAVRAYTGSSNQLWFGACVALLIYLLHRYDRAIVEFRLLRWLALSGMMSFSLYLVHLSFGGKVIGLGSRFVEVDGLAFLALQACYWAVALGAGWVFFLAVERPLERFRHASRTWQARTVGGIA